MPTAFHEVLFPTDIAMGATGGPGFNTSVLALASGFESRNINWSVSRANYDVSHGLKTQEQLNVLIEFFLARRGKAYGFRFKDWTDFQLPFPGDPEPVVATTNGAAQTLQLSKVYRDVGNSYTRTLKKIGPGSLVMFDDGAITTDFRVDENTGLVTLGSTLAATTGHLVSASCEFHVPVRFDVDDLKVSITDYDMYTWGQIPIIEVRV